MSIEIRPAVPGDVAVLRTLYRQLDVGTEAELPLEQAQSHFIALTADPLHCIYVAEQGGLVVGTYALIYVGGLPHSGRYAGVVEDVVVAPERQGHGIGRTMMRHALRECAARDCYKLTLSSHVRRTEAHAFYERLGFRRHGYSFLVDAVAFGREADGT